MMRFYGKVSDRLSSLRSLCSPSPFFFGGKSHADLALKQRSSQMQKLILQCGIYLLCDAERPTTACLEESELKTFQAVVRQNDRSAFVRKRGTTKRICDQLAKQFSKLLQGKIEVIRDAARGALQSAEHNDDDVVNDGVVIAEGATDAPAYGSGLVGWVASSTPYSATVSVPDACNSVPPIKATVNTKSMSLSEMYAVQSKIQSKARDISSGLRAETQAILEQLGGM